MQLSLTLVNLKCKKKPKVTLMQINDLTEKGESDKKTRRSLFHKYLKDRVRFFRKLRGLTQYGAANAVGISKNMWSQIETGRSGITLDKLPKFYEVLQG